MHWDALMKAKILYTNHPILSPILNGTNHFMSILTHRALVQGVMLVQNLTGRQTNPLPIWFTNLTQQKGITWSQRAKLLLWFTMSKKFVIIYSEIHSNLLFSHPPSQSPSCFRLNCKMDNVANGVRLQSCTHPWKQTCYPWLSLSNSNRKGCKH